MSRVYNFSAGPATIPESVLQQAQAELLNYRGCGTSIMEMSHRSQLFIEVAEKAEADLRELMNISDDYAVLFLQGGAQSQFSMVPLNLLGEKQTADYFNTGLWSRLALDEASRYCDVQCAFDDEKNGYHRTGLSTEWTLNPDAAYVHMTSNETVHGVQFAELPNAHGVPIVADMSSDILSRVINVNDYGLIYAGAQKNIGPSGVTIVIVRKDLLGHAHKLPPKYYN
jgi:phosphoserine aminotransferase